MKTIFLATIILLVLVARSWADPVAVGQLNGPTVIAEAAIQSTGQPLLVIGGALLQNGVGTKRLVQKLHATCAFVGSIVTFTTPLSTIDLSLQSTFNLTQSHTTLAVESNLPIGLLVCQLIAEVRNIQADIFKVGIGTFFSAELSISYLP